MRIALVSGLLIDGTGRPPLERSVIGIEDGRIEMVATMDEIGDRLGSYADVIDCVGKTLIPGLIDAHVHLTFSGDADVRETRRILEAETTESLAMRVLGNAQQALRAGITTLRRLRQALRRRLPARAHGDDEREANAQPDAHDGEGVR